MELYDLDHVGLETASAKLEVFLIFRELAARDPSGLRKSASSRQPRASSKLGALDMEHIRETLVGPECDQALKEASMLLARATALRAYAGRLGQGREGTPASAAGSVT